MHYRYLLPFLLCLQTAAQAQEPVTVHYWEDKANLSAGAEYLSNNVYLGRKDTTALPYITPLVNYQTAWGLYAEAAVSYAPTKGKVDLTTLEAGYNYIKGEHLSWGLDFDKFFYSSASRAVRSEVKESLGGYLGYDNDYVEPLLSLDLNFGRSTDIVLGGALDHEFDLLEERMSVTPALTVYAGTQHYYDDYFRRISGQKLTKADKEVVRNAGQFGVLDYELSLPVVYQLQRWTFTLTPVYVFPVNAATLTIGQYTFTQRLSNTFFTTIGFVYHLPVHKDQK